MNPNCTIAIIVSYFPREDVLRRLVLAVVSQVAHVVIVDNGSPAGTQNFFEDIAGENVHCLLLGHNFGIAKAQNAGIAWARTHDATHVVLLDQDSVPSPNMVMDLLDVHQKLNAQGKRVAAVRRGVVQARLLEKRIKARPVTVHPIVANQINIYSHILSVTPLKRASKLHLYKVGREVKGTGLIFNLLISIMSKKIEDKSIA